jgi:valyl-tRNA synthetase
MVKPDYGQPISSKTYSEVIAIMEDNLRILHPFVPFVTEEIWQHISKRSPEDALIIASWPKTGEIDAQLIKEFNFTSQVISGVRTIRKEKNISFKESIVLSLMNSENTTTRFDSVIKKLGNISEINYISEKIEGALSFRVRSNEYFVPVSGTVNVEEEIAKLTDELKYNEGFLKSVQNKLKNERFVNSAPEKVVAMEKQKEADALAKIETIKASLAGLQ